MSEETRTLPEPVSLRWSPLRSGILNIYLFDDEEFWFEDGHLLLRGNNATGKSRILALQLPFLLDGEIIPARLEPDGDTAKRMEWNLLMHSHEERLGYTWIEFGRRDHDGVTHYTTLGCGLFAARGKDLDRWFFVTDQRVGRDFSLRENRRAQSKKGLEEALGERGRIFTRINEYRDAVDKALFGLGKIRYKALVDLLIQLRKPQLSRSFDQKHLSAALSEALPPLAPAVIDDVAESFRSLENERLTLGNFNEARSSVDKFLTNYRQYVRMLAKRRAAAVRTSHYQYEERQSDVRELKAAWKREEERLEDILQRINVLKLQRADASERIRTLESSPEMKDAQELDRVRQQAEERDLAVEKAEADRIRCLESEARADEEKDEAEGNVRRYRELANSSEQAAAEQAELVGLQREHDRARQQLSIGPSHNFEPERISRLDAVRRDLETGYYDRRDQVKTLRGLIRQTDNANQEYIQARKYFEKNTEQLTQAQEEQVEAHRTHGGIVNELVRHFWEWSTALTELRFVDPTELAETLRSWCETCEGDNPVREVATEFQQQKIDDFATEEKHVDSQLKRAREELERYTTELENLRAGVHQPPPLPYTREPESRQDRPGAPLWMLCDFTATVSAPERAGIEAALEASGLLDSWVTPDGRLLDRDLHDTLIMVGNTPTLPSRSLLNNCLVPAIDRALSQTAAMDQQVVASILARIGFTQDGAEDTTTGELWVSPGGRWRVGPLHGAWVKEEAQHIGQSAREASRRRRMSELEHVLGEVRKQIRTHEDEVEHLRQCRRTFNHEMRTIPNDSEVRGALAELNSAEKLVGQLRLQVEEAEQQVQEKRQTFRDRQAEQEEKARDMDLTTWDDRLDDLDDALQEYRSRLDRIWFALRTLHSGLDQLDRRVKRLTQARDLRAEADETLTTCLEKQTESHARLQILEKTVGAKAEEVLRELEEERLRLSEIGTNNEQATEEWVETESNVKGYKIKADQARERLEEVEQERQETVVSLAYLVAAHLLPTAEENLADIDVGDWSVSQAVGIARRIDGVLSSVSTEEDQWERNKNAVYRNFQDFSEAIHHEYSPALDEKSDGIKVVTVPFQGETYTALEFRDLLTREIQQRQTLLNAKEREVLENHLIGEVAQQLTELLHRAHLWIEQINEELLSRPMSTGMTLKFRWEPVDEEEATGLKLARKLLLKTGSAWSEEEREALGHFLHKRITIIRQANETGTWQEHLSVALDYRSWHQFLVERKQAGESQWKVLNKRTHGTGSGGEKAIALTIPQFAAAAAHYKSAGPHAPRLILLDEAFVGVDADMRGKCMGFIQSFDLDFVMTSEREWGCYPTLPGVAIYQLAKHAEIDAVGLTRWVWNGRERLLDENS